MTFGLKSHLALLFVMAVVLSATEVELHSFINFVHDIAILLKFVREKHRTYSESPEGTTKTLWKL